MVFNFTREQYPLLTVVTKLINFKNNFSSLFKRNFKSNYYFNLLFTELVKTI